MSKHLEYFSDHHKKPNEEVVANVEGYVGEMMGQGKDKQHNGTLIVTTERVVFYRKGFFGEVLEAIPLKNISSVERLSMMGHHRIEVHATNNSLTFKSFLKDATDDAAAAIENGRDALAATTASAVGSDAATVPNAVPESPLDLLRKLGELKVAGVISEAEFEAKKAELLARI